MQAIFTRYCCPTNSRGARVKAWCDAKTRFIPWDHALNPSENFATAATQLAQELGWLDHSTLVHGCAPQKGAPNVSYVHVLVSK